MPTDLEQLMLEADIAKINDSIRELEQHILNVIPHEIIIDSQGGYNLRNRYGAIMVHAASLRSILNTFLEELK